MRYLLKIKRKEKNYSQSMLASKMEISRTHYTQIELGIKNPSFMLALKMKEVLEYHDDDLFENTM